MEPIWDAISIYEGPVVFLDGYAAAPHVARDLFAAHWCQSEVLNGGFAQFFSNSTGVLAPEAEAAYRRMGMHGLADCVAEAMRWFGTAYPRDRDARNAALSKGRNDIFRQTPFGTLDESFDRLHQSEADGFVEAADRYARQHVV